MTTSRPAVGNGGFSDADWQIRFGGQDGIIEDYDGHSLDMTLLNASDEAQFTAAQVSINGYTLTVLPNERVSLPAPTSGTRTFYVCAVYDPALNVADGAGNATVDGPCRFVAYDSAIDTTGGKRSDVQYVITRTSAALSSATVADRRNWVGVVVDSPYGLPVAGGTDGIYPRGSVLITPTRIYRRTLNTAATPVLDWVDALGAGPYDFPYGTNIVARNIAGNKVQYRRRAGLVMLSGDVARSSGNLSTGSDVTLGKLPAGFLPANYVKFACSVSGTGKTCEVRIDPDGTVTLTDNGSSFTWLNLSPVIFEAVN